MIQTSQPESITSSNIAGSLSPLTSLIMLAPASKALLATWWFLVSMDTLQCLEISLTSGITLDSSSSIDIGFAPGLVDSPPISIQSAPSAIICIALSTPPSRDDLWNESGVALMIPITRGRLLPLPSKTAMLTPLPAAGFITCGASGVPMSEDEGMIDDIHNGHDSDDIIMPSEDKLLFAERIFSRLNPSSIGEIPGLIHKKAKTVGGIFAGYAVFWWLTVLQVENEPAFESIFFGPEFLTITILAPCLIFLGSLLSDFSRELGQLFPGLASGIMFVLAVLYTFEPAIMGLMGDVETGDAIWKTFRLAVLCTTVLMAAKLLIDAWLLVWVKEFMEKNPGIDYSNSGEEFPPVEQAELETEA